MLVYLNYQMRKMGLQVVQSISGWRREVVLPLFEPNTARIKKEDHQP
jgi:hypothetical protein